MVQGDDAMARVDEGNINRKRHADGMYPFRWHDPKALPLAKIVGRTTQKPSNSAPSRPGNFQFHSNQGLPGAIEYRHEKFQETNRTAAPSRVSTGTPG